MANSEYNYIPTYIRRTINNRPKDVVTAKYWNELFNLLITQGDHTAEELGNILNYFSTRLVGVESEIAESAEAIANIRGSVVIEGTASDDMSEVTITTPDAWTLVSEAWNSEKRPLVVLRLSDVLCAYLTSVSTWTIDDQSTGMALFFLPPLRHLHSTPPYSIWMDESGGAAILPVESAVESVNGKTGAVTLNASDVGAQRTLIAGSGITIIPSDDGDHIQSDAVYGNGEVSFVDVAGGAPIASFTLNQMQDCEINVNDLTAHLDTKVNNLEVSLSNNYRTAADQDAIDNTKLTDAPADDKAYARKNGSWHEITGAAGAVESVNGKTGTVNIHVEDIHYANSPQTLDATIVGLKRADAQMSSDISELQTEDASLDSRIIAIETGGTPVTLYIYWESVVGAGWVSLTENGTAMSVTDFISKMQSGAKIIIGENSDTDSEAHGFSNYRYKITDSTTASLAFDVANSYNVSNRTIIISGSSSTNGLMSGYQDIAHDDLSDYSPLPEGSTPASKAWVEDYVDEKAAALQTKSITDSGGYFHTDTVEGALQEIGAELAGVNTLLGSGIQISFTIDDGSEANTFSAVSGETWTEWIGTGRIVGSGLVLYIYGGVVATEAGVYALSLDGSTAVSGSDKIISGATYTIINYGG